MKIYIPHLHYKIEVKFNSAEYLRKNDMKAATEVGDGFSVIHLKRKPKYEDFPTVAHEVMHVIQSISKDRGINMVEELEHCGYLMQYILNQILGMDYKNIK